MMARTLLFHALAAATLSATTSALSTGGLVWEEVQPLPDQVGGRHHPITFANETHGFFFSGTSLQSDMTNDMYIYSETDNTWTDVSSIAAFPGQPRSFGYGVALPVPGHSKAYLGFGFGPATGYLSDLWEFDMETLEFRQLASCPGNGRRHPAMVPVQAADDSWEIHVGLGDGVDGNYNDWWAYRIESDTWEQQADFPSSKRHHPFYFPLAKFAYAGLGHSTGNNPYIERDWYHLDATTRTWTRDADFASYNIETSGELIPVTTEARVAGTQFSIELDHPEEGLVGSLGFVLSGDGDDHGPMETGEFHAFDGTTWHQLPPHPGVSRWAPGSFVLRGTPIAYFTSGYDRNAEITYADLWRIDLSPLFETASDPGVVVSAVETPNGDVGDEGPDNFENILDPTVTENSDETSNGEADAGGSSAEEAEISSMEDSIAVSANGESAATHGSVVGGVFLGLALLGIV